MLVKIELKAFENITNKYEQLMNLDEVPDSVKHEFLQEADNVLHQCKRIIASARLSSAMRENEKRSGTGHY
jgi:hypothetical protein